MLERTSPKSLGRNKDAISASVPLVSGLPYISAFKDNVILLRDGDLMVSFAVSGINADTKDDRTTIGLSDAMSRFISQQRDSLAYYIHRFSYAIEPESEPIDADPFTREIDKRWQQYLKNCGLRERVTMVTIIMSAPKRGMRFARWLASSETVGRQEMEVRCSRLEKVVEGCMSVVADAKPKRLSTRDSRWLGYIKMMIDGIRTPLNRGMHFTPLADIVATSMVTFSGDTFLSEGSTQGDARFGAILSLKDYPPATYPGILDRLNLHFDMVVSQSFTPIDNVKAQHKISLVRRQMKAAEDAAISLMHELTDAEDDVASNRLVFGDHHCSVTLFCKTLADLDEAVTFTTRALQEAGGSVVRERFASRSVYFAQHPGNYRYRTRPAMISSQNFAQLCALHDQPTGLPAKQCPWGQPIAIIPTARGEVFRFSFHLPGKLGERTVGHTLVLGQTGSGKTLGTAFLLSQAQRLKPRIILFDKDSGFEMAVRAMGGDYNRVRMGEPTGFNPFQAEADERGVAWLTDWLTVLAENEGGKLDPIQTEALTEAVRSNVMADPQLQNFEELRGQLRSTDDEGNLFMRLGRWDVEGQFGWLFSGKGADAMNFSNRITAFDLTEIFDNDTLRTAWLSYVFRRIERQVEDEHPTFIVLDEAWKLLDDPYFERRLKDWMLTMRKKNVVVILLTQRVSHITQSAAGSGILESAVTRLVYPSIFNTEKELEPLGVSTMEMEFLRTSNVDNHLVLFKSGADSVVLDLALHGLKGGLDVLGGGAGKTAAPLWRDDPMFFEEMMK